MATHQSPPRPWSTRPSRKADEVTLVDAAGKPIRADRLPLQDARVIVIAHELAETLRDALPALEAHVSLLPQGPRHDAAAQLLGRAQGYVTQAGGRSQ